MTRRLWLAPLVLAVALASADDIWIAIDADRTVIAQVTRSNGV